MRKQLAGMILGTTGVSGKERLQRHRMMSTAAHTGQTAARAGAVDRWSKTVWVSSVPDLSEK